MMRHKLRNQFEGFFTLMILNMETLHANRQFFFLFGKDTRFSQPMLREYEKTKLQQT